MTLKCFTIYLKRKYKLIARDSVTDWDTDIKIDRKTDRKTDWDTDRKTDRRRKLLVLFYFHKNKISFFSKKKFRYKFLVSLLEFNVVDFIQISFSFTHAKDSVTD